MAVVLDLTSSPDMIARTSVTFLLLVYAVYVPSTARRTLVVAALMTLPLLGCIFDARADLYALGAVGYWLLTGTHVFAGNSAIEVCAHHLNSAPEPRPVATQAASKNEISSGDRLTRAPQSLRIERILQAPELLDDEQALLGGEDRVAVLLEVIDQRL